MSTTGVGGAAAGMELAPFSTPPPERSRRKSGAWGRRAVFAIAAIYFLGPLAAAIAFTLQGDHGGGVSFSAYGEIFSTSNGQITLGGALVYSLEIAVVTIVVTIGLLLPTQLLLHLRLPRWRGIVEVLTLFPLVFPPIVFVVGISDVYAWAAPPAGVTPGTHQTAIFKLLKFVREDGHPVLLALVYVILAMPFAYRALDAGIRSIDSETLVEAARNLGAGWGTVLVRVLMPSLRTSIVNASFLCFALVMGEYTISSILLYTKPFPVWLAQLPTQSGQVQAAVSVFSLLLVELILLLLGVLNVRRPGGKKG
jgi:putative spermidine/putrescine transport system permease protein